jgi:hypothetical protein
MVDDGAPGSAAGIAKTEGITWSFFNRLLTRTLLAPDIQDANLDGWQARGTRLEGLTRAMAMGWKERLGIVAIPPD